MSIFTPFETLQNYEIPVSCTYTTSDHLTTTPTMFPGPIVIMPSPTPPPLDAPMRHSDQNDPQRGGGGRVGAYEIRASSSPTASIHLTTAPTTFPLGYLIVIV